VQDQQTERCVHSVHCMHGQSTSARQTQGDHLSGKLEMSGNLEHVREMSGMLLAVREMSGKKSCHGKVSQNCSLLDEY